MKITQDRIVKILPKLIIFGIAFYNFAWAYWQTLDSMAGRGIGSPWYSTKDFPIAQFFLLIAAYLLFIPRIWSYAISVLISGYFSVSWMWMIADWFWTTDYSLTKRMEIITSSYFGNLLQIWECQIVISLMILVVGIYNLRKKHTAWIMP